MMLKLWRVILISIPLLLSLTNCKQFSPNKHDAKLKEVENLWASLPIPAGFEETWRGSTSKSMLASVSRHYKSDARYDDVKSFYVTRLIPEGWHLSKEEALKDWLGGGGRQLTFTKEEYSVVIEYEGEKAIDPDWNYAIGVGWQSGKPW